MLEMIFTKILLSVLFLCRAFGADDLVVEKISAKVELATENCVERKGFKSEVANQTKRFWDKDFEPTPEVGCLYECILKRLRIVDDNGDFDGDEIDALYRNVGADGDTAGKLKASIASKCPHEIKDCAAALKYAMCFRDQYLELHSPASPQPEASTEAA